MGTAQVKIEGPLSVKAVVANESEADLNSSDKDSRLPYIGPRVNVVGAQRRELATLVGEAFVSRTPRITTLDLMTELGRSDAFVMLMLEESGVDLSRRWASLGIKRATDVDLSNQAVRARFARDVARLWNNDPSVNVRILALGLGIPQEEVLALLEMEEVRVNGPRPHALQKRSPVPARQRALEQHQLAHRMRERYLKPDEPTVKDIGVLFGYSTKTAHKLLVSVGTPIRPGSLSRKRRLRLYHEPEAITRTRVKAGLSKLALANRAGVSEGFIRHIEAGKMSCPLGTLMKISDALGCPVADLVRKRTRPSRRIPAQKAAEIARRAGYEPEEDYPGLASVSWKVKCIKCGSPRRKTLTKMQSGRHPCKHSGKSLTPEISATG